jgi:hypothetical protein
MIRRRIFGPRSRRGLLPSDKFNATNWVVCAGVARQLGAFLGPPVQTARALARDRGHQLDYVPAKSYLAQTGLRASGQMPRVPTSSLLCLLPVPLAFGVLGRLLGACEASGGSPLPFYPVLFPWKNLVCGDKSLCSASDSSSVIVGFAYFVKPWLLDALQKLFRPFR